MQHTLGGALALAAMPSVRAATPETVPTRRIMAMSDIHIGKIDGGHDGSEWLRRALADVAKHFPDIAYGVTLGDITQNGQGDGLTFYKYQTRHHKIPKWFELAGNHEYYHRGIKNYQNIIRPVKPYSFIDGNIAWFFLSDEKESRKGNLTPETLGWLEKNLQQYNDHITIVCSHQLVAHTVRKSEKDFFQLHPVDKIQKVLNRCRVDLWMCGHEHHSKYAKEKMVRKNGTTFINIASLSHAYRTGNSGSALLEFTEGSTQLRVRRRNHDQGKFHQEFETVVPLRTTCKLTNK